MDSKSTTSNSAPENAVSDIIKDGFQTMTVQTAVGVGAGFLAGLVLMRGGGGTSRKVLTGFAGGCGLGSAWTRCSIHLEEALADEK